MFFRSLILFVLCLLSMSLNNVKRAKQVNVRGLKRKLLMIEKSGGACVVCGYNKNLSALHFHHVKPGSKLFALNQRNLAGKSMKELQKEFLKCELLCANCHSEHHNPTTEIDQVKKKISDHEENRV